MLAAFQSSGTSPVNNVWLKRKVSAGDSSCTTSLSNLGETLSGPLTLFSFNPNNNLVTPGSEVTKWAQNDQKIQRQLTDEVREWRKVTIGQKCRSYGPM